MSLLLCLDGLEYATRVYLPWQHRSAYTSRLTVGLLVHTMTMFIGSHT